MKIEIKGLVGKDFDIEDFMNYLKKEFEKIGIDVDIEYSQTEYNIEDFFDLLNKKIKKKKKVFFDFF